MKNIKNILLAAALALPLFTACDTDIDSNPILSEPDSFVLNTPANATNNVYNLGVAKYVELTCNQPDYGGFPLSTTYEVQVSLGTEFKEKDGDTAANYASVSSFPSTKIDLDAADLNSALIDLWTAAHEGEAVPTDPQAVIVRLKAMITGSDNRGVCYSNVITLPKVLLSNSNTVSIPKTMFLNGSMLAADWSVWKSMAKVSGKDGEFWALLYFKANDRFKFGTKEKEYIGADSKGLTINDKASAGVGGVDDGFGGKNFQVTKAGWYVVYIKASVKSGNYVFTMSFYPGDVYVFGAANGGKLDYSDDWKFTVPADASGSFVSPAMASTGEVRMCVKTEVDWWRTEFTIYKGNIFYREDNPVNSNWHDDMGADYSLQANPGNVITLDFTKGTGSMK